MARPAGRSRMMGNDARKSQIGIGYDVGALGMMMVSPSK